MFISYAHKDEAYRQELTDALEPLAGSGLLDVWHDRRMIAGDDIFPNIAAALERARIVVLLVSEAFLGSEECAREMWRALDNRRKRGTVVVPVILRRCDWRGAPFGKLNALPVDGVPLDLAEDRAAVLAAIAAGLVAVAEDLARSDAVRRRRRRRLLAAAASALLPLVLRFGLPWRTSSGADPVPTDLTMPGGVFVLAEIRATAPDGKAWNPQAEGVWRLPVPLLCFRQTGDASEVCQPSPYGEMQGRQLGRTNASHVAESYAAMTGWNRTFLVRLKNQLGAGKPVLGQGECRFGEPCRIQAVGDASVTIAEVLVLPALDATDAAQRRYLERCVGDGSLLVQQWRVLSTLAGTGADRERLSYGALALRYAALDGFELSANVLDALLEGRPAAFASAGVRDAPFRAQLWLAAVMRDDGVAPSSSAYVDVALLLPRLRDSLQVRGSGAASSGTCDHAGEPPVAPQPSSAS
nr:toll/interleukin-1 receptor domain-containing protein [Tahibacter caeni]